MEISLSQRAIPFGYPSFAFPREQSPTGYTNRVVIFEIIYTITTPSKIIIITIMIKEKETINLGRGRDMGGQEEGDMKTLRGGNESCKMI